MDYHRQVQQRRRDQMNPGQREEYILRWFHIAILLSVLCSPAFGPLVTALLLLLTRGEQHDHTEREALIGVNFGITVAIVQLAATAIARTLEALGVDEVTASIPVYVIAFATVLAARRAFFRTKKNELPRYRYSLQLVVANRDWFPPVVNNKQRRGKGLWPKGPYRSR